MPDPCTCNKEGQNVLAKLAAHEKAARKELVVSERKLKIVDMRRVKLGLTL